MPAKVAPVCVVTGGSRGIGLAIVQSFLSSDMIVYSLDIVPPEDAISDRAVSAQRLIYVKVDVADPCSLVSGLQHAFDQHKRLDCVVNNAAIYEAAENGNVLWDDGTSNAQVDRILQTNLGSVVHGTREAFRLMKKSPSAPEKTIVNIASMGAFRRTPQRAVYGATKAGILHFSQSADMDLRVEGVRVYCVCPGIVDTEMGRMGGERNRQAVARLKGGKRTRPELVAEAVLGLVQRREELKSCSYLMVDNHAISVVPSE